MLTLRRILRDYQDAGSVNSLLALWGFVDDRTFLTKTGDVGVVYRVAGADYECLDQAQRRDLVHRFEAALRPLDSACRVYQYLCKRRIEPIEAAPCRQRLAHEAIQRRTAYLNARREELYDLDLYLVLMYEGLCAPRDQHTAARPVARSARRPPPMVVLQRRAQGRRSRSGPRHRAAAPQSGGLRSAARRQRRPDSAWESGCVPVLPPPRELHAGQGGRTGAAIRRAPGLLRRRLFDRMPARTPPRVVERTAAEAVKVMATHDGTFIEETYNLLNAWLSVVPGNRAHNLRRLALLEANYADLSFLFTLKNGEPHSPHLGREALAVFETRHQTPYHFNLHVEDVGHALVLGATGSGKSFLLNFLVTHAQKYEPLTVIFDLGHNYRKLASLLQGSYLELGLRQRDVSINPFALEPTPENLHFLHAFTRVLLEGSDGYRLSEAEDRELYEAVENLYVLDATQRRLFTVANLLPRALAGRLSKWIDGGRYADLTALQTEVTDAHAATITVKITPNDRGNPAGKLAEAELHFGGESPLAGLKLIGFSIWERRGGNGRNVTFPARSYSINGERRSFVLLRPVVDTTAQNAVRERILEAYAEYEEAADRATA